MADPKIVMEWLKKADEDYGFALSVVEDSTFYAQICFHFHQAAEKYLKAYIIANDFYTDTRYPVHWPTHYTKEEAQKAKNASKNIRDLVKQALKQLTSSFQL